MHKQRYLIVGGILMIVLGLARGGGGVVLLTRGAVVDPGIHAAGPTVAAVGAILLLLGLALVVAAIGVLRRRRPFWLLGGVCTIAFVVDGAINGYLLYGRPGDKGTVVNLVAAALILGCLLLGKGALRDRSARHDGDPGAALPRR